MGTQIIIMLIYTGLSGLNKQLKKSGSIKNAFALGLKDQYKKAQEVSAKYRELIL